MADRILGVFTSLDLARRFQDRAHSTSGACSTSRAARSLGLVVLAFTMCGFALDDIINPRMRER